MTDTQTTSFPPTVHAYTDVLRLLASEPGQGAEALADATGRVRSNVRRDLPKLLDAGVVKRDQSPEAEGYVLTEKGRRWVIGADVAEGRGPLEAADADPANLSLRHDDIQPDPDNARRDWTSEDAVADLEALATDIRDNGLLQNLIVRRNPDVMSGPEWILVGGERRWRAVGLLIERGSWLPAQVLPARRLDANDVGIRLAALAENLQRRNLNPIEEANAYRGLEQVGLKTKEIAERVSMTQRHIQMRLQLLDLLTEDQQRRMTLPADDKDRLSVTEARRLVANAEVKARAREKLEADLPTRARLIFAEIRIANPNWYGRVPVDAIAMNADPDAITLNKAGYLKLPTTVDLDGVANTAVETGGFDIIGPLFGDNSPTSAEAYAAILRTELGLTVPDEGQFSTPWLNGPFTLPPEVESDLDARRAARDQEEEARAAQVKENIRLREAASERATMARTHAEAILDKAAMPPAAPTIDGLQTITSGLAKPLPWTPTDVGTVIDDDARLVTTFCGQWQSATDREVALAILTATAVNTAAGLETPPLLVTKEPEQAVDGSDPDADEDQPEDDDQDVED